MKATITVLLIMELYGLTSCVKTHFFINKMKTWYDAQTFCKSFFNDISTFTDENEVQQFLQNAGNVTIHSWVGLYKESGIWKWSGGKTATQIIWDTAQPDNNNCAFLHKDNKKLHDKECTGQLPFFCMNTEIILLPQNKTWEEALEYCRYHYTDLASLNSGKRFVYALRKITAAQTNYVWTGLRFLAGEWFWVSGDYLDYTVWPQAGHPKCPASNSRCGALDKINSTWSYRGCEEKLKFICS